LLRTLKQMRKLISLQILTTNTLDSMTIHCNTLTAATYSSPNVALSKSQR
jgi:hypothetical protein